MGITSFSIELLDKIIIRFSPKTVIELGAQNLYNQPKLPAPYANEYYESKGLKYKCIDLSKENNCIEIDLSKPMINKNLQKVDLITDFGTSEHISNNGIFDAEAFYNCWKIKHDILNVDGVMINENPKTGNWPGHGFNYVNIDFYSELIMLMNYELIELGEHPAMGNITDGWNIYCIFQKKHDADFISLEKFKTLKFKSN